jgi:hypothetical protein
MSAHQPLPWKAAKEYQRRVVDNAMIEVRHDPTIGRYIVAREPLLQGDIVCGFAGQWVTNEQYRRLAHVEEDIRRYSMANDGGIIIPNPEQVGGHLASHSCRPNAAGRGVRRGVNVLCATRDIAVEERITIYYGWRSRRQHPCLCGEAHCTGTIGLPLHPSPLSGHDRVHPEDVARLMQVAAANRNSRVRGIFQSLHAVGPEATRSLVTKGAQIAWGPNWEANEDAQWFRANVADWVS